MADTDPAPQDYSTQPPRRRVPRTLVIVALAFIAGLGGAVWGLSNWDGARRWLLDDPVNPSLPPIEFQKGAAVAEPSRPSAPVASAEAPSPAPIEPPVAGYPAETAGSGLSSGRAEALVALFAARRAVDRGTGLGAMEALLNGSFATSQPRALATLVSGAKTQVTLDALRIDLEKLAPELRGGGPYEGWWDGLKRTLSGLVVVRSPEQVATDPETRIDRAQALMANGKVDGAIAEIARVPGRKLADVWLTRARTYVEVQRALDTLEQAAMDQWPVARPAPTILLPAPSPVGTP